MVVVGGGPAGLGAARVCALRAHYVILLEAAPQLGGQVLLGTRASWRRDLIDLVDWRVAELERLSVETRLNGLAEAEDVAALSPDCVIVATEGLPDIDWIDGAQLCTSVGGILPGADVLIYDGIGRHPAPHCAEMCAIAGRKVKIVGRDGFVVAELTYVDRVGWKTKLYQLDISTRFDHRPLRVARRGFVAQIGSGDSPGESSMLAGMHEQTDTTDLQDEELVR